MINPIFLRATCVFKKITGEKEISISLDVEKVALIYVFSEIQEKFIRTQFVGLYICKRMNPKVA